MYYTTQKFWSLSHSSWLYTFHMPKTSVWCPYSQDACVVERETDKWIIHGEGQIVMSTTEGSKCSNVLETYGAEGRWLTHTGRKCCLSRELSDRRKGIQFLLGNVPERSCSGSEAQNSHQEDQRVGVYSLGMGSLERQERGRWRRLDFIPSVRAFTLFPFSDL